MAVGVEQDVVRLDVAVDVALAVDEVEGRGHVRQPARQSPARRGRGARCRSAQPVLEAAAGEVLHDGEGDAVVLADVEDLDDVRVGQRDQRADLAGEAGGELGVLEQATAGAP